MGALYQFELCIECILGPASTRTLQSRFSFARGCTNPTAPTPAPASPGGRRGWKGWLAGASSGGTVATEGPPGGGWEGDIVRGGGRVEK